MFQENESVPDFTVSYNKATGEKLGSFKIDSADTLVKTIEKARIAQIEWEKVPLKKRADLIKNLSRIICERCDEIAQTISKDNGKTRVDAIVTEILPTAMSASYYAKKAKKFLKTRYLKPGSILLSNKISQIKKVPFGVVGIISPWNYPFAIPFSEVVMALLAGNTVILKTAGETQLVGNILKEVFESAGFPENVFN
jgi:succinate-semialdehyde dehydrogenase/glutarate-semialdehyde dehydrogenase